MRHASLGTIKQNLEVTKKLNYPVPRIQNKIMKLNIGEKDKLSVTSKLKQKLSPQKQNKNK